MHRWGPWTTPAPPLRPPQRPPHRAAAAAAAAAAGWTAPPGVRMFPGTNGAKTVTLEAATAEFLFNNGGSDWDHPGGGNNGNYVAEGPGRYRLENGQLERL